MIKFLQELFPYLATLPFAAKFLVSFAILLIVGAILVIMWTPPSKSGEISENKNTNTIDKSSNNKTPEINANMQQETTPSPTITPKSSPTLPVVSTPELKESPKPIYPKDKTLEGLKRLLSRTSPQNKQILLEIANAGENGLYIFKVMEKFKLSRNDVAKRAEELEKSELIEILELTDKNFRLHENIWEIIGPNGKKLLDTMLK
jgi:hypothetical protein